MDYVTRQFINLTKKFRKDLRNYVSDLNSALHKQTEEIRKTYQAGETKKSPPPEVTVLNHLPESIEIHHNAKDTSDERNYRRASFFVTALTLGAIVVYADLVNLQYREMISATKAAQQALTEARLNRLQADKAFTATVDQFHLDQRAWVSIKSVRMTKPWSPTTLGEITVFLANSGKTPALNVHLTNIVMKEYPRFLTSLPSVRMNVAPQSGDDTMYIQVPPGPNTKVNIRFVIEYWDIFQKSSVPPHTTAFCGHYPSPVGNFFFNDSACTTPN